MLYTVTTYRDPVGEQEKHLLEVATNWAAGKGSIYINNLAEFKECLIRERNWFERDHPKLKEVSSLILQGNVLGQLRTIEVTSPGSGHFFSVE